MTACGDVRAIWRESRADDHLLVSGQGDDRFSGREIPQYRVLALGAGEQFRSVWGKLQTGD